MKPTSLRKKYADLQTLRNAQVVALRDTTGQLSQTSEQLQALTLEQEAAIRRQEYALRAKTRDLPERSGAFAVIASSGKAQVFLPQVAMDHAPMLRLALKRLFPAFEQDRSWDNRVLGSVQVDGQELLVRVDSKGLSVEEADVLMVLLQASAGVTETVVETTVWEVLERLGRSRNNLNADRLHRQVDRLASTYLKVTDQQGRKIGSKLAILRDYTTLATRSRANTIRYVIDRRFAALYSGGRTGWTPVNLAQYARIDGRRRLARWLALVLSSFGTPSQVSLDHLHAWSGSTQSRASEWRRDVLAAAKTLEDNSIGFLKAGASRLVQHANKSWTLHVEKRVGPARFIERLEDPVHAIAGLQLLAGSSSADDAGPGGQSIVIDASSGQPLDG